jgi:hypothetical protein
MTLVVTFTRPVADRGASVGPPVAVGRSARTETISVGGTSAAGALLGTTGDTVVRLRARADCWVAVGMNPTAAADAGWFMDNGEELWLAVRPGDKVAVIEAA